MAPFKPELFDTQLQDKATMLKALAHPARLAILLYLAEIKTCMTGDIADELPLGRTTVNQHLKELKNAGLIKGTVEGVRTNYCLNPEVVSNLKKSLDELFEKINTGRSFC
jgi:ArsR family transcriptional regulator, arsenate/arsenite/antimonite-responsive transcriptional repressor